MIGLLGTFVNIVTVIVGSTIGIIFNKAIPKRLTDNLFKALGLVTLFIGISGCLCNANTLVVVISMIIGCLIGELIDLDKRVNQLGEKIESKFDKNNPNSLVAQGFVSACMLFCIGSMTVVGCLQAGLKGDNSILFTKSALDFCSSIILSATMGFGVIFSAAFVLFYQGALTLLAVWVSPFLNETVITNMSCTGYVIIIGLSLTMLGVFKGKITNLVPAMFIPILLYPIGNFIIFYFPFLGN